MATVDAVEVFDCLKDYYQNFIDEGIIKNLKVDNDIFIWEEVKSGIKVAIKRENLITQTRLIDGFQFLLVGRFFQDYNYELDNRNMKFFKDKGFYINNSAEFLFQYSKFENGYPYNSMVKFNIDDVEFEIGEPSKLFKVMFHHLLQYTPFKWDNIYTIKLKKVNKEMLENYLQNAMYVIHKHAPSEFVGEYPQVYKYLYTHDYYNKIDISDEKEGNEVVKGFRVGKYPEALAFYNEGKQKRDFLSFYKVLEYFFFINRKNEFEDYIKKYNEDNNLDQIIKKITNVYRDKEMDLLKTLINSLEKMEPILESAFSKGLISNQDDKIEFAKKLYEFRNSKVHGKGDANFELVVPTILNIDENNEWEIIIEKLAEMVINQFCFSQAE